MQDKEKVLACVWSEWRDGEEIADEVSFVFKETSLVATVMTMLSLVLYLKEEGLVEEHDFGDSKKLNLFRLTPLGQKRQSELLADRFDILRHREDFLFSGCPT